MFEFIANLINRGHKRSVKAKKNIVASFLIKGISVLIGFYLVPLTVGYVQKEQYGIWLTLSSVVGWFAFFDIGLGHGLRNKLSEAMAKEEWEKAKIYVSSTYAILGAIFAGILLIFFVVEPWFNWQKILNSQLVGAYDLRLVVIATFSFFCLNFILRLIDTILYAYQKPAYKGFFSLLSNILTLIIIVILTKTTNGSLFYLSLALGISPMIVLTLASVYMFSKEFKPIAPSLKYVKKKYFNDLIGLGARFFVVNISVIIIFATDNMIITQLLGPAEVPAYALAHKYFGLITVGFSFILVPMWSAYTEAYVKNDINWVLSVIKKLKKTWLLLVGVGILMFAISPIFFKLWIPEIEIPLLLSGNIPLSYFFAKTLGLGATGVIGASIICIVYGPIFAPIQFKKIINGTASGIWNR